jgi:uncharacterized protein YqeY
MLYTQIKSDLTTAQKEKNSYLVGVLKLILSELSYAQVEFKGGELPDTDVIRVLAKEAKKRKDSIEAYTNANRPELVESEKNELKIIEGYLPVQMTEEEVSVEIAKVAEETGLRGGRLMGAVMGKLKGKTDGAVVQKLVNEKFS